MKPSSTIWDDLSASQKTFFALAPMNDVTDSVFRQIVARCCAPDVFFTEFISVDSLASPGRAAMDSKLHFTDGEKPLIVQIWGNDPNNYEKQSRELSRAGYDGIDINMGCPVAKIISKGACSALIKDRHKAKDIITATQSGAGDIAVSVKTRIGFDKIDLTWIEFLLEQNLSCLTVHCRTTYEQSKIPNHFEVLSEIVSMRNEISPNTKLVANGDVTSHAQGEELAEQYGLDGIMIGRGIFGNPFVFDPNSPWNDMTPDRKLSLFLEHIDLFETTWQGKQNIDTLKKFVKTYIVGFVGAPQIRDHVMGLHGVDEIREYLTSVMTLAHK